MINIEKIKESLSYLNDPFSDKNILDGKNLELLDSNDKQVKLKVEVGYPIQEVKNQLHALISQKIESDLNIEVKLEIQQKIQSHKVQTNLSSVKNIKNIIAVASGKGGVGKSTVSTNIAVAIASQGAKVGLLDADIYGPSQQMMMNLKGKPETTDGKKILPMSNFGIEVMSIGVIVEEDSAIVWRGPMVTGALQQLLNDTQWNDLDYLIIDLPPGTGDIQLTLAQKIPVTGSLIVTTPQDISLIDARRAIKMFEKVNIPILGIVENMSTHICSNCGHIDEIFGSTGASKIADEFESNVLANLPLTRSIREHCDQGLPVAHYTSQDEKIRNLYIDLARKVTANLACFKKDLSIKFPKIVVKND